MTLPENICRRSDLAHGDAPYRLVRHFESSLNGPDLLGKELRKRIGLLIAAFNNSGLVHARGLFGVAQIDANIAELPVSERAQKTANRHRTETELGSQRLRRLKRQFVQMLDQIFGDLAL